MIGIPRIKCSIMMTNSDGRGFHTLGPSSSMPTIRIQQHEMTYILDFLFLVVDVGRSGQSVHEICMPRFDEEQRPKEKALSPA